LFVSLNGSLIGWPFLVKVLFVASLDFFVILLAKIFHWYIMIAAKYSGLKEKYDSYFDRFLDKMAFIKVDLQFYSQRRL
jgi:hypothetical protein